MNYQRIFFNKYSSSVVLLDIVVVLLYYGWSPANYSIFNRERQTSDDISAGIPSNKPEFKESTVSDLIWPISTVILKRDFHIDQDFADIANGAKIVESSETWDRAPKMKFIMGIPWRYGNVYDPKTLIRKNRPLKREKCWMMAVKGNKEGFFEIDFGRPINISSVRYEHHEIKDQNDELTAPFKFKVYAVNSNGFLTFLVEFNFSSKAKVKAVGVNEIQFKTSKIKVEVVGNGGSRDFTRLCKFYVYGKP
uniref:SUN domain-containing protein n=1 Tax=Panagrolaimus sp. JU765 TaxID=591449 RepID=A0AC34RGK9_9BILA